MGVRRPISIRLADGSIDGQIVPYVGTPCRLWIRACNKKGYPIVGDRRETGEYLAHRASWVVVNGPIPTRMKILHKCDIRHCIREDHLFLGTDKDNSDDKIRKGRAVNLIGADHGMAVLTEQDVYDIRASSESYTEQARRYGVTPATVRFAKIRYTWKHLP